MFAKLVLEYGIAPDYALDKMEFYEIAALSEYSYLRHKESWERSRMLAYTIAQTKTKKRLKLTDICKFVWDDKDNGSKSSGPSREEVERLRAQARAVLDAGIV